MERGAVPGLAPGAPPAPRAGRPPPPARASRPPPPPLRSPDPHRGLAHCDRRVPAPAAHTRHHAQVCQLGSILPTGWVALRRIS